MIQKEKILSIVMFAGFIIGIIYVNLVAGEYLGTTGILNSYNLKEYVAIEIKIEEYLPIVLWVRILPLLFLIIIGYSEFRKPGVILFCGWTGFLWGCYMSLSIIQLKILGIGLCIISTIPHMLFYLPAYFIVVLFAYKQPSSRWTIEKICVILLSMVVGISLEVHVSPIILKWFINVL